MSDHEWFQIQIQTSATTWRRYNNQSICKKAIEQWLDWVADPAREDGAILRFHGITNSIDRAETFLAVKMEDIQAMDICDFL